MPQILTFFPPIFSSRQAVIITAESQSMSAFAAEVTLQVERHSPEE